MMREIVVDERMINNRRVYRQQRCHVKYHNKFKIGDLVYVPQAVDVTIIQLALISPINNNKYTCISSNFFVSTKEPIIGLYIGPHEIYIPYEIIWYKNQYIAIHQRCIYVFN